MVEKINLEKILELLGRACDLDHPELESMPVWNHALRDKSQFELIDGMCYSEELVLGKEYLPVIGDVKEYFDNRSDMNDIDLALEPELKNIHQTAVIHAVIKMEYCRPRKIGDPDIRVVYRRYILQEKISPVHISDAEFRSLLKSL